MRVRCADAKLAFAGDEGAGIQMAIEGGVYAEEERRPVSDGTDSDEEGSGFAHRAPSDLAASSGKSGASGRQADSLGKRAEFWEAPGGQPGVASPLRGVQRRPRSALKGSTPFGARDAEAAGGAGRRTYASARSEGRPESGGGRPGTALVRPGTARSVLFRDADAAYAASDYSGSDDEPAEAVGTGIDIAMHLQPSQPGVGHTLYSDWSTKDYQPNLQRLNIVDYLEADNGLPKPYQEDTYYEGASIRAVDYWNLKRVAREIRKGQRADSDVFCSSAKESNLLRIDALVPSRQVKFEAGARIRAILSRYTWLWRRKKAAIKMQATYRMYLTKTITRTKRAEKRQKEMDRDARDALKREREAAVAAEERKRSADAEAARKVQEDLQAKAQNDAAMLEAAKLQAEINALHAAVGSSDDDGGGDGGEVGEEEDEEEEDEEDEEDEESDGEEGKSSRHGDAGIDWKKAERKRMRGVFVASGERICCMYGDCCEVFVARVLCRLRPRANVALPQYWLCV